ncbi:MAG: sigma-54-dependent Fis family transcriptional regulator [Cyclobacteriaceae bacterium]|nr:sigma-54-dependent Fis family transcriptional regulator [Cyclobacteriaceae bacterium]
MAHILIIDDDKDICLTLSKFLTKNGYQVEVANNGESGLQVLRNQTIDLILCDYRLPDYSGLEVLQKIKILSPASAVIIITGYSDVRTAVETFRYGASDYVTKPLFPDELLVTVKETLQKSESKKTHQVGGNIQSKSKYSSQEKLTTSDFIVGKSIQSQTVQKYIELIAPSDMSVIVHGETGTGKEFVAQSIHRLSKRNENPFVAIDCGALPKELAGSELFGHIKGSFTGAVADKPGSFEVASGGTIFLDEIGNLSYENQIKLLRVIQERKIKRIGATKDTSIDVRIVAATNEDLTKAVKEGKFREDLYHRLNEFKIQLSPLRERRDDIMVFAEHFLTKANTSLQKDVKSFSPEVAEYLKNYYWHGNLRELANVVKRSVLLTTGDEVLKESLPVEILQVTKEDGLAGAEENKGILKSIAGSAERQAIIEALEKVAYNKSKAADLLNIDRKTLYNKLKLYNIPM